MSHAHGFTAVVHIPQAGRFIPTRGDHMLPVWAKSASNYKIFGGLVGEASDAASKSSRKGWSTSSERSGDCRLASVASKTLRSKGSWAAPDRASAASCRRLCTKSRGWALEMVGWF